MVYAVVERDIHEALSELASDENADAVIASLEKDESSGERGNGRVA